MKTYTHNLYLIERTKLLEGALCQSLTFSNPLENKCDVISALISVKDGGNNDTTELYPPCTEVKLVVTQHDVYDEETKQTVDIEKEFYYIVGGDDSTEISVN